MDTTATIQFLRDTIRDQEERLQEYQDQEEKYQKQIAHLQEKLDGINSTTETPFSTTNTYTEKNPLSTKELLDILMYQTAPNIGLHQHIRTLFDLLLFSAFTPESAEHMNRVLEKTHNMTKLIEKYSLKKSIPVKKYRHPIEHTITKIESYKNSLFQNKMNLQVRKYSSVPDYLYCDAVKMDQILLYLLIDILDYSDTKVPVYLDIQYAKKILTFKIKAKINPKVQMSKTPFKTTSLFKPTDPQICLRISHKIAKYIHAEIRSNTQEESYTHIFQLSASESAID